MRKSDNMIELGTRMADLVHEVAMLESLMEHALETSRHSVTFFARLAAIARYATTSDHSKNDLDVMLASIRDLAEQYERDTREHHEALRSAYAIHQHQSHESSSSTLRH
ncbi:hypothetical protein [Burkholderia sp. BCC0405]|uniref:hypothetical protein n=1 Tax=Burkholderia sp. BCC0405 TaxID=2676298 RepID=UPI00158C6A1A|nr:hypothetical protein [Burkholderia sp. BCC0405]